MDRPSKESQPARQPQQHKDVPPQGQERVISPFMREMRQGMGLADDDPRRIYDVIQAKREANPVNFFRDPNLANGGVKGRHSWMTRPVVQAKPQEKEPPGTEASQPSNEKPKEHSGSPPATPQAPANPTALPESKAGNAHKPPANPGQKEQPAAKDAPQPDEQAPIADMGPAAAPESPADASAKEKPGSMQPKPEVKEAPKGKDEECVDCKKKGKQGGGKAGPKNAKGGKGGDAEGGKEAVIKAAALDGGNGAAVLTQLNTLSPVQQIASFKNAPAALNRAQNKEVQQAEEALPEMEAPTGLPVQKPRVPKPEAPAQEQPKDMVPEGEAKGPAVNTQHPLPQTPVPGSQIQNVAADQVGTPEAFGSWLQRIPTTDNSVDTSAGPRPEVDLTGEADPRQNEQFKAESDATATREHASANTETTKDFGENDTNPTVETETLRAKGKFAKPKRHQTPLKSLPALDDQMVAAWDPTLQQMNQPKLDDSTQKALQAQDDYKEKSDEAYRENMQKIDSETAKTKGDQIEAQTKGKAEVEAHRESWREENKLAKDKFEKDSKTEQTKTNKDIDAKVADTNKQVDDKLDAAEKEAADKKREADEEAAKKKAEAEKKRKNRKWWQKIGDAVGDFFNMLKEAVKAIFDVLRSVVKGIFELAKKAAMGLIELGRKAIVGLIKVFGEVLKGLVKVLLFAFPKLRDKFVGYIDAAVKKTTEIVNKLAEGLKKVVAAYLDFLASVWTALLDVAQGLVMVQLLFYEMILTGNTELLDGIANLVKAGRRSSDFFWDAVMQEMTGMNPGDPLPGIEWNNIAEREVAMQERMAQLQGTGAETGAPGGEGGESQEKAPSGLEMDSVPQEQIDPELLASLGMLPEGQPVEMEGATDPVTMKELASGQAADGNAQGGNSDPSKASGPPGADGGAAGEPQVSASGGPNFFNMTDEEKLGEYLRMMLPTCDAKAESGEGGGGGNDIAPEAKVGPLDKAVRRGYIVDQLTKGLSNWWECNKVKVIAAAVGVLLVGTALTIITGGGFLAMLPPLMKALAVIFLAAMLVKMEGHLKNYIVAAWKGDIVGGAKSLAHALAVGAVELIFNVIFKVGGSIFKMIKAVIKGILKAVKYVVKLAITAVKAGVKGLRYLAKIAGKYLARGGKWVFQGFKQGFTRGAKSLGELRKRILDKFKFKGLKFVRKGIWFEIWAEINPWVLLATGKVKEITDAEMNAAAPGKVKLGHTIDVKGVKGIIIGAEKDASNLVKHLKGSTLRNNVILYKRLLKSGAKGTDQVGEHVVRQFMKQSSLIKKMVGTNLATMAEFEQLLKNSLKFGETDMRGLVKLIKRIEAVGAKNFDRVIADMRLSVGGHREKFMGAEFVLRYFRRYPKLMDKILEFEKHVSVTVGKNKFKRFIDAVLSDGRRFEFKNWGKFKPQVFVDQIATDFRLAMKNPKVLADNYRWVFSGRLGDKLAIRTAMVKALSDPAALKAAKLSKTDANLIIGELDKLIRRF